MTPSPVLIGYVEDDDLDVMALRRALRRRSAPHTLRSKADRGALDTLLDLADELGARGP